MGQQLQYLWRGSVLLAREGGAALALSHSLCLQFVQLAGKHSVALPAQVKERICSVCSAVQLPSLTCTVRVRPRSLRSRVNRKQDAALPMNSNNNFAADAQKRRLKNEVVRHCLMCGHSSRSLGAPRKPSKAKAPQVPAPAPAPAPVPAAVAATKSHGAAAAKKPAFSFLSAAAASSSPGGLLGDFVHLGGGPPRAPYPHAQAGRQPHHLLHQQQQQSAAASASSALAAGQKRVSLVDLEREKKKAKKLNKPPPPPPPPPPLPIGAGSPRQAHQAPHSLGALAGLLQSQHKK